MFYLLVLFVFSVGLKDSPPTPKMKVLYSDKYKLAYCTVPKAGSTNMKKLLWVLNGKVKSMDEIEKVVRSAYVIFILLIYSFLATIF